MAEASLHDRITLLREIDLAGIVAPILAEIDRASAWSQTVADYQTAKWEQALETSLAQLSMFRQVAATPSLASLRRAFRIDNRYRGTALARFQVAVQSGSEFVQRQWLWAPSAYSRALLAFLGDCACERVAAPSPRNRSTGSVVLQRAASAYVAALESNNKRLRPLVARRLADLDRLQSQERDRLEDVANAVTTLEALLTRSPVRAIADAHALLDAKFEALCREERDLSASAYTDAVVADVAIARARLHRLNGVISDLRGMPRAEL